MYCVSNGKITKVEFFVEGSKLAEVSTEPFFVTWTNARIGSFAISATATDDKGATAKSDTVNVAVAPAINTPKVTPSGEFEFNFVGEPGRTYLIEASFDLINWTVLESRENSDGNISFRDITAGGVARRFYRVVPKR